MRTAFFLGYYAASSGNYLLTIRDDVSVPSSGVKNPRSRNLKSRRSVHLSETWGPMYSQPIWGKIGTSNFLPHAGGSAISYPTLSSVYTCIFNTFAADLHSRVRPQYLKLFSVFNTWVFNI